MQVQIAAAIAAQRSAAAPTRLARPPSTTTTSTTADPFDRAVDALHAAAAAGKLPGAFLGRLASLLHCVQPRHEAAVNAALAAVANLRTTLVVGDRPTAMAVVQHFAAAQAGVVTCKVRLIVSSSYGSLPIRFPVTVYQTQLQQY